MKPAYSPTDKFSSLLSISRQINSEKNLGKLLQILSSEAARLIEAERAMIYLFDKAKCELWTQTPKGRGEIVRHDARKGIAGAVLLGGQTLLVENAHSSPLFDPAIDSSAGSRARNILSVPLRTFRNDVIGVFQIMNKRTGKFMPEDEPFLEALAAQAAVALENARALWELEIRQQALEEEVLHLRQEVEGHFTERNILGTSPRMNAVRSLIDRSADTSVPVLITGENGTGKELAARAIHHMSARRDKPFIALNCAALPEALVESELFGIEKGVATGVERRVGRIESAHGGTLFLDEIGDLSITSQAKLLRVLQEGEVEWVGGRKPVFVDVRVVAATNKDLEEEIREGRFRRDLYFRLNVVHLILPPLREIKSDIPLLATHFLRKHSKEGGLNARRFSEEALASLASHNWPGNIRELENEVRRAIVMSQAGVIGVQDLSPSIRRVEPAPEKRGKKKTLKDHVTALEIQLIRDALAQAGNQRLRAAQILGLSHQGLLNKLKRYKIAG